MPDTMTLPEKLVAAAAHPESWDVRGLLMDAADALVEHCDDLYGEKGLLRDDPEDDDEDDEEHNRLIADLVAKGNQLSNMDNCRREVVPGWTLDEILSREG